MKQNARTRMEGVMARIKINMEVKIFIQRERENLFFSLMKSFDQIFQHLLPYLERISTQSIIGSRNELYREYLVKEIFFQGKAELGKNEGNMCIRT